MHAGAVAASGPGGDSRRGYLKVKCRNVLIILNLPVLLECYVDFCKYRNTYGEKGTIDLSAATWFCPTTLLPLGDFLSGLEKTKYMVPKDTNVRNYVTTILENEAKPHTKGGSYIPIMKASKFDQTHSEIICDMISKDMTINEKTAVKTAVGELLDNIDQHSFCASASFMAQRYEKLHVVEVAIFDNGITIPGSFRKSGKYGQVEDAEALRKAVGGFSTKPEDTRGHGLPTFLSVLTDALEGTALIVSGSSAYLKEKNNNEKLYSLDKKDGLDGTLIGMRIPLPMPKTDVYEYIK